MGKYFWNQSCWKTYWQTLLFSWPTLWTLRLSVLLSFSLLFYHCQLVLDNKMQMQVGDASQRYVWVRCAISAEEGLSATSTVSTADCKHERCGTGIGYFDESHPVNTQALKLLTFWDFMLEGVHCVSHHGLFTPLCMKCIKQNITLKIQPNTW